tara:strand:+ start:326 stop:493 length:168 start_codon:yes stop_codon:yes gene_type:complete
MNYKSFIGLMIVTITMGVDVYFANLIPSYILILLMLTGIFMLGSSLYDMWKKNKS